MFHEWSRSIFRANFLGPKRQTFSKTTLRVKTPGLRNAGCAGSQFYCTQYSHRLKTYTNQPTFDQRQRMKTEFAGCLLADHEPSHLDLDLFKTLTGQNCSDASKTKESERHQLLSLRPTSKSSVYTHELKFKSSKLFSLKCNHNLESFPGKSVRSFSTSVPQPRSVLGSAGQGYTGRNVRRSSRNHNESTVTFSGPKLTKIQDRSRQNIKGRVSRLKARMKYHNKLFEEKLTAQQIQGSIVVGKLRKRLLVKKENIKTIPNLLTTLRMTSAPVLAYLVVNDNFGLAFGVFIVAGLTDMLDGYIARNFKNQTSALGTALDPLADKLLMSFLTVSLTAADLIPFPMTALILSRDAGLIVASFYIRYISLAPPRTVSRYFDVSHVTAKLYPSLISKVNTGLQLMYVAATLASPVFDCVGHPLLQGLMYVTASTTFLSGADYMITWRRRLKIIKNN